MAVNVCFPESEAKGMIQNEMLSKTFYDNPTGMSISRLSDGLIIDVNQAWSEMTGYNKNEAIGKTAYQLGIWIQPHDRKRMVEELLVRGNLKNQEYRKLKANGDIVYTISSVALLELNDEKYLLNCFQDDTERKKAGEVLRLANMKFTQAFHHNQTPMVISRFSDGLIIDANQALYETTKSNQDEVIGKTAYQLGMWMQPRARRKMLEELIEQGFVRNKEHTLKDGNGDICHIIYSVSLLEFDGEKYLINSFQDITKRKKAEEKLKLSEEKFSKSFHKSGAMKIIARYKDGVILDVNESFASTHGYVRQEIIGKTTLELGIWEDPAERQRMYEQISQVGMIKDWEFKFKTKSGESANVVTNFDLIDIEGEECIIMSSVNITRLKQYEKEIARLDSLNLMGQMAGSIAHEIRNPMTAIKGYLQLFQLQDKYLEDRESLELMIGELDRVNDIITAFLSMSRKNYTEMKLLNLNDCIIEVLQLIFADAIKNDVYVTTKLQDMPQIMIDKGEIRQLLLNLTRNAIEAMPSGGILTVHTFEDVSGINLIVRDNGVGIPQEVIEKIGTPFLTTKKNGTGLGMLICYSIAERHNANIKVDTSSEGTSFKVTFPIPSGEKGR